MTNIMVKKMEIIKIIIRSIKMILILTCLFLVLAGYVIWYVFIDTKERFVKYKMVKKK